MKLGEALRQNHQSYFENTSPGISSMTKVQAIKHIYKLLGNKFNGIFSDKYWKPVQDFFNLLRENEIFPILQSAEYKKYNNYNKTHMSDTKVWIFEIYHWTNNGKKSTIYGILTASGAGNIDDPLSKYDLTCVLS